MQLDSESCAPNSMTIYFLDFRHLFSIKLYSDSIVPTKKCFATTFTLEMNEDAAYQWSPLFSMVIFTYLGILPSIKT